MRASALAVVSLHIAIVACGGGAPPPANAITAPPDEQSFAVRDVRVFDGERVLEHTSVVVRAGRIAAVGGALPGDVPVLDGRGRTLLPGLSTPTRTCRPRPACATHCGSG